MENEPVVKNGSIKGNFKKNVLAMKMLVFTLPIILVKQASLQTQKVLVGILKHTRRCSLWHYVQISFDVSISPIILWENAINAVEKIHIFQCKNNFLRVESYTPILVVFYECDRFPMSINSHIKIIKYWLRLEK